MASSAEEIRATQQERESKDKIHHGHSTIFRYCPHCDAMIDDDAVSCYACGQKLTEDLPLAPGNLDEKTTPATQGEKPPEDISSIISAMPLSKRIGMCIGIFFFILLLPKTLSAFWNRDLPTFLFGSYVLIVVTLVMNIRGIRSRVPLLNSSNKRKVWYGWSLVALPWAITFITMHYSQYSSRMLAEDQRRQLIAATEDQGRQLMESARIALAAKDVPQARKSLAKAATLKDFPHQKEAQRLLQELLIAINEFKVSTVLLAMTETEFSAFMDDGVAPAKKYFSNPHLNEIFIQNLISHRTDAKQLREAERARVKKILRARIEKEEKRQAEEALGPKPSSSSYDGSVKCVKDYLSKHLLDPYSVKYDGWSKVGKFEYEGELYWIVRVRYRAKNAFGAYILSEQVAFMRRNEVLFMKDV